MGDYRDSDPSTASLVRVDWEDICFSDSWNDEDGEDLQPVESTTVGYLLLETPTRLVIGSSYNWRERRWGTVHTFSKAVPMVTSLSEPKEVE